MPGPPSADHLLGSGQHVVRISHSAVVTEWRRRDRALRELGFDVTVLTARKWNEGGADVACEPAPGEPVSTARTVGTHPCGFLYDPRPIIRLLRDRRPDVVDMHEEAYSLAAAEIVALAALFAPGVPMCFYSAQNLDKRYPWPIRLLERAVLRRAAGAYVCNLAAAEILRSKGFRGTVAVIPLGVDPDPDAVSFPPVPAPLGTTLRLGFVGRVEIRKGILVLLSAMVGDPRLRLLVVGDGPDVERVQRHATDVGVAGRVEWRGHQRPDQVAACYGELDVLVVPSLPTPGWEEQFCRVAVEAMAAGVPVVASDSGALPEVVGPAGVLVPPGDAIALRETLVGLADDAARRSELGAIGRRRATEFSWDAVGRAHGALYRDIAPISR